MTGSMYINSSITEMEYSGFWNQYHACWCPCFWSRQSINRLDIGCVEQTTSIVLPPVSTRLKGGYTGFTSVCLSLCPICTCVRSVSSTILTGSTSYMYLYSLLSNFRRIKSFHYNLYNFHFLYIILALYILQALLTRKYWQNFGASTIKKFKILWFHISIYSRKNYLHISGGCTYSFIFSSLVSLWLWSVASLLSSHFPLAVRGVPWPFADGVCSPGT